MIFVTAGTQLPFPRLMEWIDTIAARNALDVFAQTAEPNGAYRQIRHQPFVTPQEYDSIIASTRLIVGHAGIGTILTAKQKNLPLIIVPRRADRGEHRNDHQLATARNLTGHRGVHVAQSESELEAYLMAPTLESAFIEATPAKIALQTFVRDWIYR